jgi:hypothetical protein
MNNLEHRGWADTERTGEGNHRNVSGSVTPADGDDIVGCQDGAPTQLSTRTHSGVSPLAVSIGVVVSASAEEEVIGITAAPNIAAMKNAQAIGDVPVADLPHESVSGDHPSPDFELAISASRDRGVPQPTLTGVADGDVQIQSGNVARSTIAEHGHLLTGGRAGREDHESSRPYYSETPLDGVPRRNASRDWYGRERLI